MQMIPIQISYETVSYYKNLKKKRCRQIAGKYGQTYPPTLPSTTVQLPAVAPGPPCLFTLYAMCPGEVGPGRGASTA